VCSSEFIHQSWTTLLYGFNNSINNYQKLDRPLLSRHLQILGWLCDEAQQLINNWMFAFDNDVIINTALYTRPALESTINSTISALTVSVLSYFQIIIPFVTEILESNMLPTAFNTDWTIEYGNESNGYLTRSIPRLYMNDTCNCVVSNSCQNYLRIGPSNLILPGLVIGCTPLQGLSMSTLECFYSTSCISTIITYLEYYTQMDGSPPNNFVPPTIPPIAIPPLNNSIESRFLPNSSIGTLINEMFVEDWISTSSYEDYFSVCAPNSCQYEYTKRQSILYVATFLLSLYGGLTVGWRFIIWNGMMLHQLIKRWYLTRRTTVQPFTIAE
jgi:hypothetical protein